MTYTGLELFMEKLQNLINSNGDPRINNHPLIFSHRPQFDLLYQELQSMIQTLFIDERRELQQVKDLKKRFKDAAQDAHDIVDIFVYTINCGNQISLNQISVNLSLDSHPQRTKGGVTGRSITKLQNKEKIFPYFEDVMRSIEFIKEEFISIRENVNMDSSPRTDRMRTPYAAADAEPSTSRNHTGTKKVLEDIVVGFDRDVALIRDKLVEDTKQVDVVSIVGMGGLGKTTLAKKVFNDRFVEYHFEVRAWVTASQAYQKQDLLIQILESSGMKPDNTVRNSYPRLREMLHKKLMRRRFLIVIDDIWSTEAWDDLKAFFHNDHMTRSRILLTSRNREVALHANSHGLIHQLQYLTEDESWELLCKKVFHGANCLESLIEPGREISKNCHGLPLTLVVMAGVLEKAERSRDSWERIGQSVSSLIVNDQTGHIEKLAFSLDNLPGQLRDCFLYLGGFPEDYKFRPRRLIWLWMAEGFIQEDGHQSLEQIAGSYLMELVDRNLVIVGDRKSNGGIKSLYVHDLLRELCVEIARKESFFLKTEKTGDTVEPYKQRRIFVLDNINIKNDGRIRSLLYISNTWYTRERLVENWYDGWMLLMVLDIENWEIDYFPKEISQLVHLRYLAFWYINRDFPSEICNLWSLQTLIVNRHFHYIDILKLPNTISNLVNLRHLHCKSGFAFPLDQKPMKDLQTISRVTLRDGAVNLVKCFPGIKKLSLWIEQGMKYDFQQLTFLENMKLSAYTIDVSPKNPIRFPTTLKKLTLQHCYLSWSDMSAIQSLPKLEVLKLQWYSFVGPRWDAGEEPFPQLKFLKLSQLEIKQWEASSINFPRLEKLVVERCPHLEEIPSDFGYIPTLELIDVYGCGDSLVESLDTIREEQQCQGNIELKITVKRLELFDLSD